MAKPPVGVVFDSGLGSIDDVLTLALLYSLEQKSQARVVGLSTSRPSLKSAALMDAFSKFYFGRPMPVGMPDGGAAAPDAPMLDAVVPKFRNEIKTLNDTADPAATIRNAFTAQHDGNCAVLLSGPPANILRSLALPGVKELAAAKVRLLMVVDNAGFRGDPAAAEKLLKEWPGPVVIAPAEIGEQIPFPQTAIDSDFAWATEGHPLIAAYQAYKSGPYDAPSTGMAAALHAVHPDKKYFGLTPESGNRQKLVFDPARKEEIEKLYRDLLSAKPVSRFPRRPS